MQQSVLSIPVCSSLSQDQLSLSEVARACHVFPMIKKNHPSIIAYLLIPNPYHSNNVRVYILSTSGNTDLFFPFMSTLSYLRNYKEYILGLMIPETPCLLQSY